MKPQLILIAGGSASGKTTFAHLLYEALAPEAIVLSMDNYYRDLSHLPMHQREHYNFDHPDALDSELLQKHIQTLLAGESIHAPQYDFTTHTRRPQTQTIHPAPYIIVEGLYALYFDSIVSSASVRVFIDYPADLRLIRRIQRDIRERQRNLEHILHQYLNTVRPMHLQYIQPTAMRADYVITTEHFQDYVQSIISRLKEV